MPTYTVVHYPPRNVPEPPVVVVKGLSWSDAVSLADRSWGMWRPGLAQQRDGGGLPIIGYHEGRGPGCGGYIIEENV